MPVVPPLEDDRGPIVLRVRGRADDPTIYIYAAAHAAHGRREGCVSILIGLFIFLIDVLNFFVVCYDLGRRDVLTCFPSKKLIML